jgi:hypothetical protein
MSASSLLTPVVFLLLLTSALFALLEARAQPRPLKDEVAFYIDTYGEVLQGKTPRWHAPTAYLSGCGRWPTKAANACRSSWWSIVRPTLRRHASWPQGGAEILELDHFVQMQVLRGERLGRVGELAAYCARPLRQRPLMQGIVWFCDHWAALALGNRVQEVWWVAE